MNLNIEIHIPDEVNVALDVLRALRGMTKKAIITEALTHYTNCVGGEETTNAIRRGQTSVRPNDSGANRAPRGPARQKGATEGDFGEPDTGSDWPR